MAFASSRRPLKEFVHETQLDDILDEAINACYIEQPQNAGTFFAQYFSRKYSPAIISNVQCIEQLDGALGSSLRVKVTLHSGASHSIFVSHSQQLSHPSSSRSRLPVADSAPGGKSKFLGLAETGAKAAEALTKALAGRSVLDQTGVDEAIRSADGTANFACIGTNIAAACSAAAASLAATVSRQPACLQMAPLFYPNGRPKQFRMPTPVATLFSAEPPIYGKTRLRELLLIPKPSTRISVALRQISRITEIAVEKFAEDSHSPTVNTDGALKYIAYDAIAQAVDNAEECIREAGCSPGTDFFIGLVVDASLFFKAETQKYSFMDSAGELSGAQLAELLANLAKDKKSIAFVEDSHGERDLAEMRRLMSRVGGSISVVGNNLFASDASVIRQLAPQQLANVAALRLNDAGTVTDLMQAAQAFQSSYPGAKLAVACEMSENQAEFAADVACAVGASFFRAGGLLRANHAAGYNRLAVLESELEAMGMLENHESATLPDYSALPLPPVPSEPVVEISNKDPKKKK